MINKYISYYFLFLFSLIPASLVSGASVSLINILLIDISFLIYLFFLKDFSFLKSKAFFYLALLYLYLIFNSFISINQEVGLARNFGFLRIIILFVAINFFFKEIDFLKKTLLIWLITILFVLADVFLESFSGKNILGYGSEYGRRILSLFKDEPIVGGYLNAFYLSIIGFLHFKFGNNQKNIILIFSILIFFSILLTGERSNSIKAFLGIFLFYVFFKEYEIKHKFFLIISAIIVLSTTVYSSDFLKLRYFYQIKSLLSTGGERPANKIYLDQYRSAYNVFKENIYFGVGNKNYRIVACSKFQEKADKIINDFGEETDVLGSHGSKADDLINKLEYRCNTHPHQIFFELLSEHGIFGSIIILYLIYKLIFSHLLFRISNLNYIQLGSGIYIALIFLPFIPSGSFFSDFSVTLFALNLSIFYASNPNFNIFSDKNYIKLDEHNFK